MLFLVMSVLGVFIYCLICCCCCTHKDTLCKKCWRAAGALREPSWYVSKQEQHLYWRWNLKKTRQIRNENVCQNAHRTWFWVAEVDSLPLKRTVDQSVVSYRLSDGRPPLHEHSLAACPNPPRLINRPPTLANQLLRSLWSHVLLAICIWMQLDFFYEVR